MKIQFVEELENAREWKFSPNTVTYLLRMMVQQIRSLPEFKNPVSVTDTYLGKIGNVVSEVLLPCGVSAGWDTFYGKFFIEVDGRKIYG